jgi:hypothetical protein
MFDFDRGEARDRALQAALLIPMVVNAVNRCLQQGNMERARAFLHNRYYPRRRPAWGNGNRGASRQLGGIFQASVVIG